VGVGAVAPFIKVATEPSAIQDVAALAWLYSIGGFGSEMAFTVALGASVVIALSVGNLLAVLAARRSAAYSWDVALHLSHRLLRGYLAQPYAFHTRNHTAQVHRTVMQESVLVGSGIVQPLLTLAGQSVVMFSVVLLLLAANPALSALLLAGIGGTFAVAHVVGRRRTVAAGEARHGANRQRNKVASEAFAGIRELKVLQKEDLPLARFDAPAAVITRAAVLTATVPLLPRYLVEVLLVGTLVTALLMLRADGEAPAALLPVLSLYVFAGVRVLPSLQSVLSAATAYRGNRMIISEVLDALEEGDRALKSESSRPDPVPLQERILIHRVRFTYEGQDRPALDGISLEIPKGGSLGVVGASGSGKSTLADVLVGLQWPSEGWVAIDGERITPRNVRAWRPQVGYVSQAVFLSDDTVLANIAFGLAPESVDRERAQTVAELAQLDELLRSLPNGLETVVGERGVRLSGGQRQRIGIARALYRRPPVLVLDEATSALDGVTERLVMRAIRRQQSDQTLVVIAHRLATVRGCDQIVLMEEGKVAEAGTWDELLRRSARFRELAQSSSVAVG